MVESEREIFANLLLLATPKNQTGCFLSYMVLSMFRQYYKVSWLEPSYEQFQKTLQLRLSPFLFAVIMDRLTDEARTEPPWTMLFVDDIVICEKTSTEVEQRLESWRYALERRVMQLIRSKTEYQPINGENSEKGGQKKCKSKGI